MTITTPLFILISLGLFLFLIFILLWLIKYGGKIASLVNTETNVVFTILWVYLLMVVVPALVFTYDFPIEKKVIFSTIGNYFAGIAAPIAFLWLIFGYRQQSKQLAINNRTMELQLQEFTYSVDAQRQQAKAIQNQLDFYIREKYYPELELLEMSYNEGDVRISFKNVGKSVYNLQFNVLQLNIEDEYEVVSGDEIQFNIILDTKESILKDYIDIPIKASFGIEYDSNIRCLCYNIRYYSIKEPDMRLILCSENE